MSHTNPHDWQRVEIFGWTGSSIVNRRCESIEEATSSLREFQFAWIDIEGVSSAECVSELETAMSIPPLASDTLIDGVRRPGADDFDDLTIVTMRCHLPSGVSEFIDFLLTTKVLVTIQEKIGGDVFDSIRERMRAQSRHLLRADANMVFLLLARAVCDGYKPVLSAYSESLEKFERVLVRRPDSSMLDRIHEHRRQLLFLRQGLAPLHAALGSMQGALGSRGHHTKDAWNRMAALREVQDEVGALLDVVEFQTDSAQHLLDLYLNAAGMRLNEIVRVLTIISVIFMPLTLIAGIYGMNFGGEGPFQMPELRWQYGYPFALGLMVTCASGLLYFFWQRGWIGDPLTRKKANQSVAERFVPGAAEIGSTWPMSLILSRRQTKHPRDGHSGKFARKITE